MTDIEGYEGLYAVMQDGRIWSYFSKKWLKPFLSAKNYHIVGLRKNGHTKTLKVHRLVAKAFVKNPNNYLEVNHLDSNRLNNHASNLEWCTHQMNMLHAYKVGNKIPWTKMEAYKHQKIYRRSRKAH